MSDKNATKEPVTILELQAENVKRLRAVRVTPKGDVVVIGGRNAQGKSSVLDSILYTVAGKRALPPHPVRDGESMARSRVTLSNGLQAERTYFPDGKTTLKLTDESGRYTSPQKLLDELFRHTFDPMAFDQLPPGDRRAELAAVVGLDFSELDRKRALLFYERAEKNRDVKKLEGRISSLPEYDTELPIEEEPVESVLRSIEQAEATLRESTDAMQKCDDIEAELVSIKASELERLAHIERLRAQIAGIEEQIEADKAKATEWSEELESYRSVCAAEPERRALVDSEKARLSLHAERNAAIRKNAEAKSVREERNELVMEALTLTRAIGDLDAEKQKQLESAAFPIDGLAFDDEGVLFGGQPWEQASLAERIRASVAMGFAINPDCGVLLIRDGSSLDNESMALLAKLAHERGGQLWIERVGDDDEGAIVIEDGSVAGADPTEAAADGPSAPEGTDPVDTPPATDAPSGGNEDPSDAGSLPF